MVKETLKALAVAVGIIGVAMGLGIGCAIWEQADSEKTFNNGECTLCETGEYKFSNATKSRHGHTYYFYECDECGYIIETDVQVFKK